MSVVLWTSECSALDKDEEIDASTKIGDTLVLILHSYDTTGDAFTHVLFAGGEAEAMAEAWHEFISKPVFADEEDLWLYSGEPFDLNRHTKELVKQFAKQRNLG